MLNHAEDKLLTVKRFSVFQKEMRSTLGDIKKTLAKHSIMLDQHSKTLAEHSKVLAQHTLTLLHIESTLKFYYDMYIINKEKTGELDNRITKIEGIVVKT